MAGEQAVLFTESPPPAGVLQRIDEVLGRPDKTVGDLIDRVEEARAIVAEALEAVPSGE